MAKIIRSHDFAASARQNSASEAHLSGVDDLMGSSATSALRMPTIR